MILDDDDPPNTVLEGVAPIRKVSDVVLYYLSFMCPCVHRIVMIINPLLSLRGWLPFGRLVM